MAWDTNRQEGDVLTAQDWNQAVQEIKSKQSRLNVVDALDSTSSVDVLSAKQGKVLDEKIISANSTIENVSTKVNKLPYGIFYGQFDNVESLPDASQLTEKGYAYVASTDPNIFYIYTYEGIGGTWQESGNKFDAGSLSSVNLLEAKTPNTKLSKVQKYQASANINDRAADVIVATGEVKALGYKVLKAPVEGDDTTSFAAQVESVEGVVDNSNMIFEIRDAFDLSNQSITIPKNSVLKFNGGSLSNGTLNSDTDNGEICFYTIESKLPSKIFNNVYLSGVIQGDIYTSWFGNLQNCLASIDGLNTHRVSANLLINVDTIDTYSSTLICKKTKITINFQREVVTTISNGTPVLQLGEYTDSLTYSRVIIKNFTLREPNIPGENPTRQNCIGIAVYGKNSKFIIERPKIYWVKYGIIFSSKASYLSSVIDADITKCDTGVWVKHNTEGDTDDNDWQNGLYFSFKDLSYCDTGFLAEHGINTIDCTATEIGYNGISIHIKGGRYNLYGVEWNENCLTNSMKVEGDGFVRLSGMTYVVNPEIMQISGNNAALYEDKGQVNYPVNQIVDARNLVFDLGIYKDGSNDILSNKVTGQKHIVEVGRVEKLGYNSYSYIADTPYTSVFPIGNSGFFNITPFSLAEGVSIIERSYCEERGDNTLGFYLKTSYTFPSSLLKYTINFRFYKENLSIAIVRSSRESTSASYVDVTFAELYMGRTKYRLGNISRVYTFDINGGSIVYASMNSVFRRMNQDVITEQMYESYMNEVKDIEFDKFQIVLPTYDSNIQNENIVNLLLFNRKLTTINARAIAELESVEPEIHKFGATSDRPLINTGNVGQTFFDTTLGKLITCKNNNTWVEYDGVKAGSLRKGNSTQRNSSATTSNAYVGFPFFDTTLGKPLFWNGSAWVDGMGEPVGLQVKDTTVLIGAAVTDTATVDVYYGGSIAPTISVLNADDTACNWLTATRTGNTLALALDSTYGANTGSNPRGAKVIITLGDEVKIINVVQNYSTT